MKGAFILKYELVDGMSEQIVQASEIRQFLDLINRNEYPSPNFDKLKKTLEKGEIFKYCQNRFQIEFIPGLMVTGTADSRDKTFMSTGVREFIDKNLKDKK